MSTRQPIPPLTSGTVSLTATMTLYDADTDEVLEASGSIPFSPERPGFFAWVPNVLETLNPKRNLRIVCFVYRDGELFASNETIVPRYGAKPDSFETQVWAPGHAAAEALYSFRRS